MGEYSRVPASDAMLDVFTIKIKTSDHEWSVETEGSWTIGQLKQRIKDKHDLNGKRIRLIMQGRLLEDQNTVSSYGLKEGDFVHAAISEELAHETRIDIRGGRGQRHGDDDDSGDEDVMDRGFDRLIHTGFSGAEIEFLRQQFHARRGMFIHNMTREEMLNHEEEWFRQNTRDEESGGLTSQRFNRFDHLAAERREGGQADLIVGAVMGFFFGIVMLFFLWDRNMTRKQKLGIFLGIGANFLMGMLKVHSNQRGAGSMHYHSPHRDSTRNMSGYGGMSAGFPGPDRVGD